MSGTGPVELDQSDHIDPHPHLVELVELDDPGCSDVELVGAKAATLSRARSLGLPVLPGFVVTTTAAAPALAAGRDALSVRGSGGARLAVQAFGIDDALRSRLHDAVAALGAPVIVRSSATVEGTGEWAGAFSSFADVDAATVVTATLGCWASSFGVDVLERAEHTGVAVDDVRMAVLLQPMISPIASGLARLHEDGVRVTAVRGRPAGLMSGWLSGTEVHVTAAGEVSPSAPQLLTDDQARAVAEVTRRCAELLDHQTVEWALVEGEIVLLQSTASARATEEPVALPVARLDDLDDPLADRLADLARRFPGGLSEELVLPWAIGHRDPRFLAAATQLISGARAPVTESDVEPGPVPDAPDINRLRRRVAAVAARVWAGHADPAPWRGALRELRGERPGESLRLLAELEPPPLEESLELLHDLLAIGASAARHGSLRRADEIFGCEPTDLEPRRARLPRQSWAGARRWEPFLAAVAQTRGASVFGTPASAGLGAGGARVVRDVEAAPHATHARSVIVATHPVPGLAPLLWNAAGLVTTQGSAGAHLLEVAGSLGVPAVVQCGELPVHLLTDDTIVAVDGDSGQVCWHRPDLA